MSRIINGKLRLDVQPVDLPAVVSEAIESVRPAAEAKGIRLTKVLDPGAGRSPATPTASSRFSGICSPTPSNSPRVAGGSRSPFAASILMSRLPSQTPARGFPPTSSRICSPASRKPRHPKHAGTGDWGWDWRWSNRWLNCTAGPSKPPASGVNQGATFTRFAAAHRPSPRAV